MKCSDVHEMLNSYFDNGTDPMQDRLIAEHIKSCASCREELDFLIRYRGILNSVKPVSAPDNFITELNRRIKLESEKNIIKKLARAFRYYRDNFTYPLEAAGVLAVALVVFFLYRPFFSEKQQEVSSEYTTEIPLEKTPLSGGDKNALLREKDTSPDRDEQSHIDTDRGKTESAAAENKKRAKDAYDRSDGGAALILEKDFSPLKTEEMRKSRSVESEKKVSEYEEQSLKDENKNAETSDTETMDSAATVPYAEKIFIRSDAEVTTKNISDRENMYYIIRISPENYADLMTELNKRFTVKEKILINNSTYYEVELFLKNR